MKRVLIAFLLILSSLYVKASAELIIDYSAATVVDDLSVERNLLIKSSNTGVYDITMRPLDDSLLSMDGKVRIPLENVYINNFNEDIFFKYNESSYLFRGMEIGSVAKNIVAKIRDYGLVPAGTYNLNFEVEAIDSATQVVDSRNTFNLQFIVPVIQEMIFEAKSPTITIGIDEVLDTNKKFCSDTNPMIYIKSNADWELIVRNDSAEPSVGNYFIRTISASNNVTKRLEDRVQLDKGQEIVIARGKAPSYKEYVTVEYSVESADNKMLAPGEYRNDLKFILKEIGEFN